MEEPQSEEYATVDHLRPGESAPPVLAKEIHFSVDENELAMGQADGTGIPIRGIRKRGKELKVFVQLKRTGGIRIAGLAIGNYEGEWEKLFEPLLEGLRKFKQFFLVTDGDTNILKGLGDRVKVIFQRCLWHIPHQFKWYLWKDGVKRKSGGVDLCPCRAAGDLCHPILRG